MTSQKHLKARIRARMARTGERYATARRHEVGSPEPVSRDHGWTLRGGVHPDAANIANVLANLGAAPLSEAMVLGIGGGLGAGYILWEFAAHNAAVLVLGYRHRWNYFDWTARTLSRLGVPFQSSATSGEQKAAAALTSALEAGRAAIVIPDQQLVGYWHLPSHLEARGGHPVVVYATVDDAVRVDDRNHGPLTVDRSVMDRARARVVSYKNTLVVVEGGPPSLDLPSLVRAGIADCVAHLGGDSTSFAIPAWRKWARLLTDTRNAKGWPRVFADGAGLTGALMSIWEGVEPVGSSGGHLRDLYAQFLDEAAPLLGSSAEAARRAATAFRTCAAAWHEVAETALPGDVPQYARLRQLTADVAAGVAAGDAGVASARIAAAELWGLRAEYDRKPPAEPDFAALAQRVGAVHEAERDAVDALRALL
jgi:hypothetical protein